MNPIISAGRSTGKPRIVAAAVLLGIGAFISGNLAGQPDVGKASTQEFMREKLEHSQQVLKALTEEDFFTMAKGARRLSAMTQEAKWQAFQNPDYAQQSVTFRRHANALAKAAQDKNIDAATLAYVRLTMSCVDCHKLVRGKFIGFVDDKDRARGG